MGVDPSQFDQMGVEVRVVTEQAEEGAKVYDELLKRMEAATAKFAASVDRFAAKTEAAEKRIQKATEDTTKKVEAERRKLADSEIRVLSSSQNYAGAIAKVREEISKTPEGTVRYNNLLAQQSTLQRELKEQNEKTGASLSTLRRNWFDIIAVFGIVTTGIAGVIGAFKVLEKAAEFRGMVKASEGLARSYAVNMKGVMEAIDAAADSTLTAGKKFKIFNEALLTDVPEMGQSIDELVKIARAAAIASGQEFDTVLEKLQLGIARGSSRLIDDARIYLKVGDVVEQYAEAHGIAADEVDAHTQQLLVLNAVLERGSEVVAMVGDEALKEAAAFQQVDKNFAELGATLSQVFVISGGVDTLNEALVSLNELLVIGARGMVFWAGVIAGADDAVRALIVDTVGLAYATDQLAKGNIVAALKYTAIVAKQSKEFRDSARQIAEDADEVTKRMAQAQGVVFADRPEVDARDGFARLADQREQQQKAMLKKEKEYRDKLDELIIKSGERVLDAESDYQRRLEEQEVDHQNKLYDIRLDGIRKREDLGIELGRDLEDADIDYQRAVEDAYLDHKDKLLKIEEKYQDRLREIQRRFEDEYWEAVKNRDAVALVEAFRNRNRGIEDAQRQRDRETDDEDNDYNRRVEDARKALERKRQDARRAYQRELEDQRRAEQRALEDERMSNDRKRAEMLRAFNQRLSDMRTQHYNELIELNAKYRNEENALTAHLNQMRAILNRYNFNTGNPGGGHDYGGETQTPTMDDGGAMIANSPTMVKIGARAVPELLIGIPLGGQRALPASPAQRMDHFVRGQFDHSIKTMVNDGLRGMEGRFVAAVIASLGKVMRVK